MINTIRHLYKTSRLDAFYAYIGFLQYYAEDPKLSQFEPFQINDMKLAIENEEVLLIRTRRGGKTRDLTVLTVFWTIVGLRVIWFSVERDQKHQPKQWLYMNPFVVNVTGEFIDIMDTKYRVPFSELTKGKSASKGADIAIFDETGKIDLNHFKYDFYLTARGIVLESKELHILHASTPAIGTVEFETYSQLDPSMISIHPWQDCHWLNENFIESEREKHPEDPWYVLQEYECMHVPRGGALLVNVIVTDDIPYETERFGADIGKLFDFVGIYTDRDWNNCWITEELELNPYDVADRKKINKILKDFPCELEDGGFNYHAARMLSSIDVAVQTSLWTKEIKSERLGIARTFLNIYINPQKTPKTYRDLIEAIYHKLYPIWLKDNQHTCHWLDAYMHALGAKGFKVYPVAGKKRIYQGDRIRHMFKHGMM